MDKMEKKKTKPEGDLEVTGVSRSGRVRKKSSKLVDFESSDDVGQDNKRSYKTSQGGTPVKRGRPSSQSSPLKSYGTEFASNMESSQEEMSLSDMSETEIYKTEEDLDSSLDAESIASTDLTDNLLIDEEDNSQDENEKQNSNLDGKSLPKKRGPKPGKKKNERKDKGKSRFTAYMLWAKEVRQKVINNEPDMDFSQVSKRLGELWHTVPFNEKYGFKRQADRLAAKYSQSLSKKKITSQKTKSVTPGRVGRPPSNKQTVQAVIETKPSPPVAPRAPLVKPSLPADLFKVTGTQPLDISAHLRLLGDNLTIIGERLRDTQILAVSGGMSLLLDSFLCALGPLLCLTQQIPQQNGCPAETLSHILDNIAYIMPGL